MKTRLKVYADDLKGYHIMKNMSRILGY